LNFEYTNIIDSKYRPKLFYKKNKSDRRVGVEIEYSNLPLLNSAAVVSSLFGGNIVEVNKYKVILKKTKYGDFTFELDAMFLQKIESKGLFTKLSSVIGTISSDINDLLEKTSKKFIPFEISSPPIPISKLPLLDNMIDKLRLQGALGTTYSFQYAFGVHFNIEPPSDEMGDILKIFKSFLILQKWIEVQSELDIARKMSPFINDFPKEYIRLVVNKEYNPDKERFIEDYLFYNPTRNRVLDMLPMLAHWDEKRVRKQLPDEKINPRPTYHYRLPNSKIDLFRWNLSVEFQLWVIVELLANNEKLFEEMSEKFFKKIEKAIFSKDEWVEECQKCVLELLS